MKIKIQNWLTPFIIAALLFVAIRPALAQIVETPKDVLVGEQSNTDGFKQIYYEFKGNKEFITNTRYTNAGANTKGEYITWMGQINGLWQIFLYNLSSKTTTQLTFTGNNVNPKIDDKSRVVWEGWTGETWQIFFFDGSATHQLTTGDTSLNPDISGEYISYGRRDITGTWRAIVYSIKDNKSVDVTTGEAARNPQIRNGAIYLAVGTGNEKKFPLLVDDLFLLNLVPLTATVSAQIATVSAETVIEELNATISAVLELPASESAKPIPESTSSGLPTDQ